MVFGDPGQLILCLLMRRIDACDGCFKLMPSHPHLQGNHKAVSFAALHESTVDVHVVNLQLTTLYWCGVAVPSKGKRGD